MNPIDTKRAANMHLEREATDEIQEFLLNVPLFSDVETREMQVLSRFFKLYKVDSESVIFQEGEEGNFMVLIMDGRVELRKGNFPDDSVLVAIEGTGKTLGEMALIDGEPRSATAKFTDTGRVLLMSKEAFETLLETHPRLGNKLLWRLCKILSQRLRRTTGLLSEQLHTNALVHFG